MLRIAQCVAAVVLMVGALGAGCGGSYFNLTQPLTDPLVIGLINKTPYRAILTGGAWEPLDRESLPQFGNARIESRENDDVNRGVVWLRTQALSGTASPACRRAVSIGSQELLNQIREWEDVLATAQPPLTITDPDAMVVGVYFSDAAADSPDAANPTVGTAEPITVLHGVDYPCGSVLVFTLVEDADAVGGFRIDYGVIY